MPYYSGSANNMEALRASLLSACIANGWSWNASTQVLSKGPIYILITVSVDAISFVGRTSPTSGNMPTQVRISPLHAVEGYPTYAVTFPATYEIFVFDQEVYMVVNYSVDRYQWCAFGRSTISLPGTGVWCAASAGPLPVSLSFNRGPIFITPTGGGDTGNAGQNTAALFWAEGSSYMQARNCWVHSNLDGQGWFFGDSEGRCPESVKLLSPLIGLLPNAWNSEAVLLPIRAHKLRTSAKISLIADLVNARYTRIDNYTPGEVITIGSDRWKVFPWHRKNTTARDGGSHLDHTGTFGWAIRYEGE